MKSTKTWQLFTGIMVLCNIGLLVTLWLKPCLPPHDKQFETPRDIFKKELGFSGGQLENYDKLVKTHREAMDGFRKAGKEQREMFFGMVGKNANPDSVANTIALNQKQIELATFKHFEQVRELCSDEQKKKFDNILIDVLNKMKPQGRPGPPPPGRQDGPPPINEGPNPPQQQ